MNIDNLTRFVGLIEQYREPSTHHHSERVSRYAAGLAQAYGLARKQIVLLMQACIFHDIGKLAISEYIINKPAQLTETEQAMMVTHPTYGAKLLRVLEIDPLVCAAVRCHHEHYDGSGYPCGLRGKAIPILARILLIADVYDAITHERPYRMAMSRAKAIQEMRKQAAIFDPELLEIFFEKVKR